MKKLTTKGRAPIFLTGEGPIEDPRNLAGALRRAIAEVKAGKLALVDTVTRFR